MSGPDLFKIFIACVGFGFGGEAIRRYRAFKQRRRETPTHIRNAGFWTDSRLYHTEAIGAALVAAIPFTAITMAVNTNQNLLASYAAILAYPAFIYLLVRGMNVGRVQ